MAQVAFEPVEAELPFAVEEFPEIIESTSHPRVVNLALLDPKSSGQLGEELVLTKDELLAGAEKVVLQIAHGLQFPVRQFHLPGGPSRAVFTRRLNSSRGSMTRRPQPSQVMRMSAPTRVIRQSVAPHGCGLRRRTRSPTTQEREGEDDLMTG